MHLSLRATIAALTFAAAAAAQTPDDPSPRKDHQYDVVVSGCLKGKRLERPVIQSAPESMPRDAHNATNFSLDGPKALMKELEQHKNHRDQLVGIATVPPSSFLEIGPTTRVGPISIGIGTGPADTRSGIARALKIIKLRVSSLVHVESACPK
jgi:hypothetical protein